MGGINATNRFSSMAIPLAIVAGIWLVGCAPASTTTPPPNVANPALITAPVAARPAPSRNPALPVTLSEEQTVAVEEGVRRRLRDPESAQFSSFAAAEDGLGVVTVCGLVNAKNSFGGYAGDAPFLGVLFTNQSTQQSRFSILRLGQTKAEKYAIVQTCAEGGAGIER